jgi:6-phosphogluconolactonase
MIKIYTNLESLSRAAAELFVLEAERAVRTRGRFAVCLSGGQTPRRTYELLSMQPLRDRTPWSRVHVFWGDERCVPPEDPRSNERMAREALLDRVPIPLAQVYPFACTGSPREAAERYDMLLHSFFAGTSPRFDLVFLGLGENGHTASLFPGTPAVDEKERWAAEVYVAEQDMYRVTLTVPVINQAAVVAFIVSGASKAAVLKQVLEAKEDPHVLPAQMICPTDGELQWLLDQAAAGLSRGTE